jgi:hypothetical protein
MNAPATIPRPSLLVLGLAVLAAHLWFLRAATGPVRVRQPQIAPAFITRAIADSAAPAAAPAPSRPAAARPHRPAPPRPAPASWQIPETAVATPADPVAVPSRSVPMPLQEAPPAAAATDAPTLRFAVPGSARLHYQVTASVRQQHWLGAGELVWRHDGTSYQARLEISAPLLPPRVQHSAGAITAEGLAPLRFSDKARGEEATHFQRQQGKVSFSSNRPDAPLLPGAQDRLSVLLQIGAMVGGDPHKFPAGTLISIQTASTRDAEPWLFAVEGEVELELPGGKLVALKLTRQPRREFDQKVELWLAPRMDYVPVRLRLTQPNGDWVDQQWSSTDRG